MKEHHDFVKEPNFNKKGYWPVDGNREKLASHRVNVDSWPMGKPKAFQQRVLFK